MTASDDALVAAAASVAGDPGTADGMDLEVAPDGTLRFLRCSRCGYLRHPPGTRCPECLSTEARGEADPGTGAVWSFCVYHRAFRPAFRDALPYNVALVELDSGPRLVSNVLGCAPGDLAVGLRVRATALAAPGGRPLVYFVPDRADRGGGRP
jgi:uncharacterized OB-fold protein